MTSPSRRKFLKRAGLVAGAGGVPAGGAAGTDGRGSWRAAIGLSTAQEDLPPLRGPYADDDWVGYRGGPGKLGAVDAGPAVNPDDPDCRLFYDGPFAGQPAIADGTMYIADGDGHILALDAETADLVWTSDDLVSGRSPSVAYLRVVTIGDGSVLALDVADGSLDWETALDGEIDRPTVGYETVFVIADENLHALDVGDGSTRWTRTDETFHETSWGPAVGNGQVYAVVESDDSANDRDLVSLDVATGDERWRTQPRRYVGYGPTAATEYVTASAGMPERNVYDADTGDYQAMYGGEGTAVHDDEVYSWNTDYELRTSFFGDREGWTFSSHRISAISTPTIAGDTVYTYYGEAEREDRDQYEHSLLAFDRDTGEIEWSCEMQADDEPLGVTIAATSEAVYVLGSGEIHVVHGDSNGSEESTPTDAEPTEEESTPTETEATPTEEETTPTDAESTRTDTDSTPSDSGPPPTDDAWCPTETDGSCPPDDPMPTDGATPTRTAGSTPTDNDSAVIASSPTEGTDEAAGDGPGLDIVSSISALGGLGYLLRRRLGELESGVDERDA